MDHALPIIRSMLSVPGLRDRFIAKAVEVPADIVLLDLEDSIASAQKAAARASVRAALPRFDKRGRLLFVRPNALETGLLEADLDAVVGPALDGIHLPKTHDADNLRQVDAYLSFLERTRGLASGAVRIIAWIESTAGVANVEAICRASSRLIAVSMGAEDYVTSLGVMRTRGGVEIEFARARVANAALANGLVPIDCPEPDYRDLEHFERDITHARELGYRGKYCIHPAQVTTRAGVSSVCAPATTTISSTGARSSRWRTSGRSRRCFGVPNRDASPAARTTAATLTAPAR